MNQTNEPIQNNEPTDYETYVSQTTNEFNTWNEAQPDNEKIHYRVPFTMNFPIPILLPIEDKKTKDRDGKEITNYFRPYKMTTASGLQIGYKVQSPSVIASRGMCSIKTNSDEILSIPCTYNIGNPEHKLFLDQYDEKIIMFSMHEIMRTPGSYGLDSIPVNDFSKENQSTTEYIVSMHTVKSKLSKFTRLPKVNKVVVQDSPLRTVFYSPTDYAPKEPGDPRSQMGIKIMGIDDDRQTCISLDNLKDICSGRSFENGKLVKGKPKGFECSPELRIMKLHIGSQLSNKGVCPNIFISRFQESSQVDTQKEKVEYCNKYGEDKFTTENNISDLIKGLNHTVNNAVKHDENFSPFGNTSINTDNTNTIAPSDGSFLHEINNKIDAPPSSEKHFTQNNTQPVNDVQQLQSEVQQKQYVQPVQQQQQFSPTNNLNEQYQSQMSNQNTNFQNGTTVLPPPVQNSDVVYQTQASAQVIPGLQNVQIPM